MVGLSDLPGEVLHQIHLYSLSPALPIVNRFFRSFFSRNSTAGYVAVYLLTYHHDAAGEDLLGRVLRHGICDLDVLQAIEWRWTTWSEQWEGRERQRSADIADESEADDGDGDEMQDTGIIASDPPLAGSDFVATPTLEDVDSGAITTPSATPVLGGSLVQTSLSPTNPYQALRLVKLNKRLFRSTSPPISQMPTRVAHGRGRRKATTRPDPPLSPPKQLSMLTPLIQYLFDKYQPSPNRDKGYPLCQAVLANDLDLVSFLLERGADPSLSDGLALQIAVSRKDVDMVKLLMEDALGDEGKTGAGSSEEEKEDTKDSSEDTASTGTKRRRSESPPGDPSAKKAKKCDRMAVTPQIMKRVMQSGSRDLVDYFVQEKGYMPSLTSIMSWK